MFITYLLLLVLMGVWVALPLLPAVLIYRLFPNAPLVVTGPLAGLTVKTGGAFAAYLIIFLLIRSQVDTTVNFIGSMTRSYWEITGELSLTDATGKDVDALDSILADLRTRPSTFSHDGATVSFKIPEERMGHLPKVLLYFPAGSGWGSLNLNLDDNLKLDEPAPWWQFWNWFAHKPTVDPLLKTMNIGKFNISRLDRSQTSNSMLDLEKGPAPLTTR
jgi:hypothetical protein